MQNIIPLSPAKIYHLYNSSVGNELLFRSDKDFNTFLQKKYKHINPIGNIIAWVLLPTSFDLIIEMKSKAEIIQFYELIKDKACETEDQVSEFLMERFGNCLNSYAKTYNIKYLRQGSLFIDYTKRELIQNHYNMLQEIIKAHVKPELSGYTDDYSKWPFSSYTSFIDLSKSSDKQLESIQQFGNLKTFIVEHEKYFNNANYSGLNMAV